MVHFIRRIGSSTRRAVAAQDASVKLQHLFAARGLMQTVNILSDDGSELSRLFKLRKLQVRRVGLNSVDNELFPMKAVVLLWVFNKESMAEDGLGRILPLLVVQAVDTAEIGDTALRAHARAAEEHDIVALINPLFKLHYFIVHNAHS